MLTPWHFASGIFFDTRTVLLIIVGLFFGPIPTAVALAMMIAFRLTQPGAASVTGIVGMILAAGLGLCVAPSSAGATSRICPSATSWRFGLGAHVVILGQTTSAHVPDPSRGDRIRRRCRTTGCRCSTVYPVATALLGVLLVARLRARRLTDANARLQGQVEAQLEEVRASRARIVEAGDRERRRVERDLHDGAQQRLVSLSLELQVARRALGDDGDPAVRRSLDRAAEEALEALAELRDLAPGDPSRSSSPRPGWGRPSSHSPTGRRSMCRSMSALSATRPPSRVPPTSSSPRHWRTSRSTRKATRAIGTGPRARRSPEHRGRGRRDRRRRPSLRQRPAGSRRPAGRARRDDHGRQPRRRRDAGSPR